MNTTQKPETERLNFASAGATRKRQYNIYNMDTGEDLGTYRASSETEALDAMARDWGFADYDEAAATSGATRAEAISELQITVL